MSKGVFSAMRLKPRAVLGAAVVCSLAFAAFVPASNAAFSGSTSNTNNSIAAKVRMRLALSGTWTAPVNATSPGVKMGTVSVVDGTPAYVYTITGATVAGFPVNFTIDQTTINGRAYSRARYNEFSIVIDKELGDVYVSRSTGTASGNADVTFRGVDANGLSASITQRVTAQ